MWVLSIYPQPRKEEAICMVKTPAVPFLQKEDVLAQNKPFFFSPFANDFPAPPSYLKKPSICTVPQSALLVVRWDAAQFMNS